jgi:pyrophosphate--fructose-6-phosphate 1-phosphotransferase
MPYDITEEPEMLKDKLTKEEKNNSLFEQAVRKLPTKACSIFLEGDRIVPVSFDQEGEVLSTRDSEAIARSFPKTIAESGNRVLFGSKKNGKPPKGKRVAVLFSGGPAAGGHNVVTGLKRVLGPENTLMGVVAGPQGLIKGELFEISDEQADGIFNSGGFDFLGSDRTKIKTDEQFEAVKKTCRDNSLDAIVVIGGDDSNTNAAILAEYLYDVKVQVIGVPKTIDGDLQAGSLLPITFGFDTATKVYAELAGNILQDTPSSRKYWHFIKVMGRSASHVALEVALQTKPAVCLISEEVEEMKTSLSQVVELVAQTVVKRAKKGINHGCVIIPEGLIEFIPEFKTLISDLNDLLARFDDQMADLSINEKRDFVSQKLTPQHAQLFASLPDYIEEMLLFDRDSHGNLQVSRIPTERLLIDMVSRRVRELDSSVKFQTQNHFFGYEGRCGAPSRFDATYTYNLGLTAGSLVLAGKTGYISSFTDFPKGGTPLAIPLTGLLNIERRGGKDEMVIEKALVETDSPAFLYFASRREAWGAEDLFCSPGPRQLWGPTSNQIPITVALNQDYEDLIFSI